MVVPFSVLAVAVLAQADNSGRIYGTIHTVDGDTFEGLIRWDKNEGSWVDVLDGTRDRDDRHRDQSTSSGRRKYSNRRSSFRLFGVDIYQNPNSFSFVSGSAAESGIRFGHLKSLEVLDDDRAMLTLKNGNEIEFSNGSTDIGTSVREIIIEDPKEGEVEFSWEDIESIEFADADVSAPSVFGERLYGTLTTRRGDAFTGFICWDVDELFEKDVLDGEDHRRTRKIPFGNVASISRYSSSGAELILESGDTVILRGTNDVDESNRGIVVGDPDLGQVRVGWDNFEKLELKRASHAVRYSDFDGGRRMHGTVYTEEGESYTGDICWDDDEEYTWELLNGSYRDIEFQVEFGQIKQIEKNSSQSADVTLLDKRIFRLRGSNDVDEENKGIIVTPSDRKEVFVDWVDFARAVFETK